LFQSQGPVEVGQVALNMLVRDPLKQVIADSMDSESTVKWIERNLRDERQWSPPVIRALTMAVYSYSFTDGKPGLMWYLLGTLF
jgi:hypothetical protein